MESEKSTIKYNKNRIIFGAPGTGKSYQLNEDSKVFGDHYERVTFHPNYSYAQFVGTYKPVMRKSNYSLESSEIMQILKSNITAQEKYERLH